MKAQLTNEHLRSVLEYEKETGVFRWLVTSRNVKSGDVAGYIRPPNNYLQIGVAGKQHPAHRLAWLYCHGSWPDGMLDHINGNRIDNRIENLRIVTNSENMQNMRAARRDSTTGRLGVARNGRNFAVRITTKGKRIYVGTFRTIEEASNAYISKKREVHSTCTI